MAAGCPTPDPRGTNGGAPYAAEEYKPGLVRTFALFNGKTFVATAKGDMVVVEGDIVLGTVEQVESLALRGMNPLSNGCNCSEDDCDRWPNRTDYYEIDSGGKGFRRKTFAGIRMI